MKRFAAIFLLILSLCLALFFTSSKPFIAAGPEAREGVLDFRGTDFTSSVYALNGQWEFYYEKLYTPENFVRDAEQPAAEQTVAEQPAAEQTVAEQPAAKQTDTEQPAAEGQTGASQVAARQSGSHGVPEGREFIDLPGPWTGLGYPRLGFATYRLTVRTEPGQVYLMYIPEIMSSSQIWVNGEPFYRAGKVGASDGETVTGVRNELLAVSAGDGVLELVVQSANYRMNGSGLFYPILMGRDTVLIHYVFWQRTILAAALGGILLMGVYHLFLYLFRRRERLYLTFSLTCLVTVLRLAMESNALVQYFLPEGIGFKLSRVFLLLFTLHSLCICLFMVQAFSLPLGKFLKAFFVASFLFPMAAICALPYATAVVCMFTVMIPYCISIVLVLRTGGIGKDPYRLLYLCGMITFLIYGPLTKTVFEGDMFVPGIVPNMFLILSQCVMLSRSYARAHDEVELVNANLEVLVEQRTAELNRANEQLASSQAALREMISNISHDLKTPLTVLNNYLELLGDETIVASEQERSEYLGIAYHKNLDLQRLIHNLFEVTRMEGGTAVYHRECVPAEKLAKEALRKYADMAGDQGIRFEAEADPELVLEIDAGKIWSVLDNLVYNGLRHTPSGGKLSLTIRRAGEQAKLLVADTGTGIGPEHLPHIFERFYKVSPARGEKDGSSGLGLYIVKTTVEAMGGSVTVESVPGEGTVFTVRLPAFPG